MRPCPFCGESIQEDAVKCRYCREWLDRAAQGAPDTTPPNSAIVEGATDAGPELTHRALVTQQTLAASVATPAPGNLQTKPRHQTQTEWPSVMLTSVVGGYVALAVMLVSIGTGLGNLAGLSLLLVLLLRLVAVHSTHKTARLVGHSWLMAIWFELGVLLLPIFDLVIARNLHRMAKGVLPSSQVPFPVGAGPATAKSGETVEPKPGGVECPKCGFTNLRSDRICVRCGAALSRPPCSA